MNLRKVRASIFSIDLVIIACKGKLQGLSLWNGPPARILEGFGSHRVIWREQKEMSEILDLYFHKTGTVH